MTSGGILPSRSIRSLSTRSRRNRSRRSMKGRARSTSAGSMAGNGCTRSSRNEPSNSSRTKLGACQSCSRAASATSRASCSVASGWRGGAGGGRTSVMAFGLGKGGRRRTGEPGESVEHQAHDVTLAALEVAGALEVYTNGRRDGTDMDQRKPAQRDDAEEELGRVTRLGVVEAQLRTDGGERLLAGREVAHALRQPGPVQRLALDQADEVGPGGEEIEIVRHGAGQDGFRGLIAGQRSGATGANRFANLGKGPIEHGTIQLGLAAEEVAGRSAAHPGCSPYLSEAGRVIAALREQPLGGIQD